MKRTPCEFIKCGKKFNQSSSLNKHKRTVHYKVQPHVCGTTFSLALIYKRDMPTHTNAMPHKCNGGPAAFIRLSALCYMSTN